MKYSLLIFMMIIFLLVSGFAQWSIDPSINNSISMAGGEQAIPKIATSENGTSYISWFSNESGNYNVLLQKLDVFGNIQWDSAALLISDHEAMSWLTDWDMTVDQADHAILTFQDIRNGNNNIYAYRISPTGEFIWGADGLALSNSSAFNVAPKVTVTNAGNTVFAWQADADVIIQKISPEGEKQWGENGITLSGSNTYSWPQLLPVGEDDIILKYFDDSGPPNAPTRHVFAQRYNIDGNAVWEQPAVISDAGSISAWTQIFPFINDGEDGFYIAWHDNRTNPTLSSIYVQHIGSDGSVLFVDDGVEASTFSNRNHFYAHLALPPGSEDIFVYWNEMDGDQNNRGIYGQKLSSEGERLWTDNGKSFIELSSTNVYPIAARSSVDDMIVVYEETTSGMNAIIKGMRIDSDGNYVWEDEKIDMCTVQSEKVHSEVIFFNNGQWIATWEDSRNGGKDIYAQNIQLDGSLGPITISNELTLSHDTLFYYNPGPETQFLKVYNYTSVDIAIQDVEIDYDWIFLETNLTLPYVLNPGDSVALELWIFDGSDLNVNDFDYHHVYVYTETNTSTCVIALEWGFVGTKDNLEEKNELTVYPNPAKDFVTFSLESELEIDYEILIFDAFGKKINSLLPENRTTIRWDLTDQSNQKVPSGTYYYRLISDKHQETGKLILIE